MKFRDRVSLEQALHFDPHTINNALAVNSHYAQATTCSCIPAKHSPGTINSRGFIIREKSDNRKFDNENMVA